MVGVLEHHNAARDSKRRDVSWQDRSEDSFQHSGLDLQTDSAGWTDAHTQTHTQTHTHAHTHSARADRHPRWCMRTHSVCSCCRYCPVLTSPPTQSIRVRNLRRRCSYSLERSFRCSPSVMAAATPATVAPLTAGRSVEGKSVHRSQAGGFQVISNMDMGSDLFMVHLQEVKVPVKMIK